jgi:low affinity Fe/Cu permease
VVSHESLDGHVADESRSESTVFRRVARVLTAGTGSATGAGLVLVVAAAWIGLGAVTAFPRWWELLVTGGVPLLTLLMLVLLQHTQNHNARATQLKLDELIRATHGASNRMMTVEDASREDLDRIQDDFRNQAESASPDLTAQPNLASDTQLPPAPS